MIESSAGIAGKDFGEIRRLWPETVIAFPTATSALGSGQNEPDAALEDALVALAGRHVKWTRLAVQQQRFENPKAMLIKRIQDALASLHLFALYLHRFDKEHFDYRNS